MTLNLDNVHPEEGLGKELFLQVSALVPIVNVDLLVYNSKGQFLLTWRDDPHCGRGWHVPGGCIRFKETFEERIRKVAKNELGLTNFTFDREPVKVFEIIDKSRREIDNQNERAHFIALAYKCYVPDDFEMDNQARKEGDVGYIKWFDRLPDDFLSIQSCYKELLR
jgi:colanic acid biosynthesis protein WcaH